MPLSTVTFATLPPGLRTEATGLFSLMRNLGSSIGISVVTSLLISNTQVVHSGIVQSVTPFNQLFRDSTIMQFWNPFTIAGRAMLDGEITRQATTTAYIDDFWLMMIVTLLAIPMVLLLRKPGKRPAGPASPAIVE